MQHDFFTIRCTIQSTVEVHNHLREGNFLFLLASAETIVALLHQQCWSVASVQPESRSVTTTAVLNLG
ncbi:uncharacterized protein LAJ45_01128 [Morchella importuna]|uniref:uncharacterized protein n=1 Tax=Morchella importuna TaxID=1174673 RepID=UPI001E8EBEBE|nr:uncharacterized protein LAJ45_01128 [Morchella importuna]KAH8154600.1 hypothetical protein LAJ45_01128 [Morchella importuna]